MIVSAMDQKMGCRLVQHEAGSAMSTVCLTVRGHPLSVPESSCQAVNSVEGSRKRPRENRTNSVKQKFRF